MNTDELIVVLMWVALFAYMVFQAIQIRQLRIDAEWALNGWKRACELHAEERNAWADRGNVFSPAATPTPGGSAQP